MSANGLPPTGPIGALSPRQDKANIENIYHYRQLSLRNNPQQHQRQVSSPATSHYYGNNQPRPISSYYEYDHPPYMKNGDHLNVMENLRKGPLVNKPHANYGQMSPTFNPHQETLYGIVGQQIGNKRGVSTGPHITPGPPSMIRQQQSIFQSNHVQIYGSVYGTAPNQQTYARPSQHQMHSQTGLYGSYPRNEVYRAANALPYPTTKG